MSSLIKIKRSAVSGKKPQLADLQVGELALNTYDGSLFIKRDTGGVGIATTVSNLSPWTESFGASSISYVSGNVGVGTDVFTDPVQSTNSKKLAVGILTAYNVFASQYFGDGNHNFYAGQFVGSGAAGISSGACFNVGIGYSSLSHVTTGDKNVVLGCRAGMLLTTASNSVFLGRCAGFCNTTGNTNVFLGYRSGGCNTTGYSNVNIGFGAGAISGDNNIENIAIGKKAYVVCGNMGYRNIALGAYSGYLCASGTDCRDFSNNIYVGQNTFAFYAACSKLHNNTIIGPNAGANYHNDHSTCAVNNTIIGADSAHKGSGSGNLFLGSYVNSYRCGSGFFGFSKTGGNLNIGIGHSVCLAKQFGDRQLAIGHSDNQWIHGNCDYNVGLGITNPTSKLHVFGDALVTGVVTTTGADINGILDVDGDTQLDDLNVAGVATFSGSNVYFPGAAYNIQWDKATSKFKFDDSAQLVFGSASGGDMKLFHQSGNSTIRNETGQFRIAGNDIRLQTQNHSEDYLLAVDGGSVSIFHNDVKRLETTASGVDITDTLNVAGVATFSSGIDANGTLDVDGDTQLDDLTVAGFATFTSNASFAGNVSIAGTLSYEDVSNVDAIGIITAGHGLRVTKGGIDVAAGISTFAGNILANGNLIGDTATNISGINSVTATSFFGDGSGLENTGATLSAASGSQRLVVTSLTSGTMTSAATDADLAFNATSNLLSTGKLNVTGLTTISNLKVDSGIVTAVSGIATYNGDLVIGTPSAGFKSGAFSINTTDKTKDSINELNFILGKLVPDPPDTINGASFTLSGLGNGRLCAGFTPVNNTGGSHAVAAGRQYSRNTDSTVTSNTLTEFGPGDSETVTGFVNAVGVGTTTLTVGVNNGTFDKLVISNNEDASNSSRNPGITSQFYEIYDARLLNAASPDGFNKAFISQGISTTTSAFWYEDPSTVSAPVISFSPVTYPASPTLSYSSGIPHYTQASANAFTYALGVENASGDMYTQNTFVSSDGQTSGFQNPGNKSYTNFTGGTNPPARNYGVGAAVTTQISQQPRDLHLTATSNVFTSFDASTPYGSHNNQRVGFTTDVNIMGTTARTNKIDEDNILITSLGTGSGNATRVNAGSTGDNPSPVFTAWGGGSAGSIATYEAAVRGAVLRHDQTDYSDGSYLPVGPDYSGSRSGTQYFQIELIRSNVSEFRISYTGSAAGCFVCMPQNSAWTTSLSGVNGWADMFQAYKGSGIPTSAEPGCSSGGLMDNDGGTFTCVFGTESSSNDTGNRILIRWKLTSGQSITAMSFTAT